MAKLIYAMVSDREAKGTEEDIVKQYSYKPRLVYQLRFLIATYDQTESTLADLKHVPDRMMILLPHTIKTYDELYDYLQFLKWTLGDDKLNIIYPQFIDILNPLVIKFMNASTFDDFKILFNTVGNNVISTFSATDIQSIVKNEKYLERILLVTEKDKIISFLNNLGWDNVSEKIKLKPSMVLYLHLDEKDAMSFISSLGIEFIKKYFDGKSLGAILTQLTLADAKIIIKEMGYHHLQSLDSDYLNNIVLRILTDTKEIILFLNTFSNSELIKLMGNCFLFYNLLLKIIKHDRLSFLLKIFSEREDVARYIPNGKYLSKILDLMNEADGVTFLQHLKKLELISLETLELLLNESPLSQIIKLLMLFIDELPEPRWDYYVKLYPQLKETPKVKLTSLEDKTESISKEEKPVSLKEPSFSSVFSEEELLSQASVGIDEHKPITIHSIRTGRFINHLEGVDLPLISSSPILFATNRMRSLEDKDTARPSHGPYRIHRYSSFFRNYTLDPGAPRSSSRREP